MRYAWRISPLLATTMLLASRPPLPRFEHTNRQPRQHWPENQNRCLESTALADSYSECLSVTVNHYGSAYPNSLYLPSQCGFSASWFWSLSS